VTDTTPAVPKHPRWSWLAVTAGVSGLALLVLVWLQFQQLDRLNQALQGGPEVRTVQMHRQATEYLQLREQWARALDAAVPLDLRALALRYDIWVGRVAMLREDTAMRQTALAVAPGLDATLDQVDAFVRDADRVMNADLSAAERRAELARLHPRLLALGDTLLDLALSASHLASAEQTERDLLLSRHTRITLAVTALLALMVLAFAGLSLRQMRQLRRRQAALESLTADLREARHAAEASSQAKSHFLANMSHEIRTPFQGLLGMLALLRDTGLDARQVDYLRTATESADHLLAVLNDILDMSQLEAGRLQVSPAPLAVRDLLRDVEALMRPQAAARRLALQVSADPAVPDAVRLDGTRVKQVLFNLLSNAIKFSQRGSVDLTLRVQPGDHGLPQLVFAVTDTGPGMDAATLARLFNRFERGDAPVAGAPGGSGLGLAISRGLARLMGGDLRASSVPGQGSCFTLLLPLDRVDTVPAAPVASAPGAPDAPRLSVLVAEDHPINRQVLAALIDSLGHDAHFVADGEAAVRAVQERSFDLVLMDLHMPALDGIDATRRIRALPDRAAATVPIVALTADAFTETRERCLVAGMNNFLTKPVSRDKLGAMLRQLFGSHAGREAESHAESVPARADVAAADSVPLIDAAIVARTLDVLPAERYARVLADFLAQGTHTVARLRQAVRDAQPLDLRQHAHATRGAALELGLAALAATAAALQDGAQHLPAHEVARLVQRLEDLLQATREAAERAGLLPQPMTARG
jgi:signal transduction histidine kinase/CheY-like chemotaxis protein